MSSLLLPEMYKHGAVEGKGVVLYSLLEENGIVSAGYEAREPPDI
jgi:hypothetical protein